jgi:acyl-[acyl-carrier-protein]-phospholipid O-acyltransferase/long-chain-fatty-acid--[acyl-carrier-protein] ligase
VVLHTSVDKSVDEMIGQLRQAGLPNIFIPSPDSFLQIEAMPVLGTGKLDLKGIKQMAAERLSS